MAIHEEILRAIEQLDRAEQLDLACWILHREETPAAHRAAVVGDDLSYSRLQ
ncbi:MAG TPA: hypothetical protein GX513_00980 [Firmicutes bacterium]|nr:hypothetical protein [Bacillota bacterium]